MSQHFKTLTFTFCLYYKESIIFDMSFGSLELKRG